MMISKDKTEKQKDIDDVLSSIDSLLDTATDVEVDELPVLEIEDQSESQTTEHKEKIEKLVAPQKSRTDKKKTNKKVTANRKIAAKNPQPPKEEPVVIVSEKPKEIQPVAEEIESEKKQITEIRKESKPQTDQTENEAKASEEKFEPGLVAKNAQPPAEEPVVIGSEKPKEIKSVVEKVEDKKKPITEIKKESKPQTEKNVPINEKNTKSPEKPESELNFSTAQTDFSVTQKELPVLDEIITEEEMSLIAAGKELPKRVITEKFIPKTTADKIIDAVAIQLADYNVTRLEYEYLHELIDEILEEDKNKKS